LDTFKARIIRILSFVSKEGVEILRQPRLILGLIVSPFILLLLVGIGYRNKNPIYRTMYVLHEDMVMRERVEQFLDRVRFSYHYQGVTDSLDDALSKLQTGQTDLVIEYPQDPVHSVLNGEQAGVTFYHNEIDPFQISYLNYLGRTYINAINRYVLQLVIENAQDDAVSEQDDFDQALELTSDLRTALQSADHAGTENTKEELLSVIDDLESNPGIGLGFLVMAAHMGGELDGGKDHFYPNSLNEIREMIRDVSTGDSSSISSYMDKIQNAENELSKLDNILQTFIDTPADVIVNPFHDDVKSIGAVSPGFTDYFIAPVLILIIHHFCVTFASLSIVKDESLGVMEMVRVSPLSPGELLLSKYLSHFLLAAILTFILSLLAILIFQVPMLGSWLNAAFIMLGLIFASLGVGYTLSLISETDSQAVQYAMMVLLATVFFSGLFFRLKDLWWPVRIVSWILAPTYSIQLLQNVTLRGTSLDPLLMTGLFALGFLFFFISHVMLKRRIKWGK
jgi:ABC-2 type transport system permease protein